MTDSSTGGYLQPLDPAPIADQALDVALQGIVAGVTGLPGNLVRVAWQPIPPKQPEYSVNWAAVGTSTIASDTNDTQIFNPATVSRLSTTPGGITPGSAVVGGSLMASSIALNGFVQAVENERIRVLVSFYGPLANSYARTLRAGIKIGQNREALFHINSGLMEIGELHWVPELVNNEWIRRVDFDFIISRAITRIYAIDAIESAEAGLYASAQGGVVITFDTTADTRG